MNQQYESSNWTDEECLKYNGTLSRERCYALIDNAREREEDKELASQVREGMLDDPEGWICFDTAFAAIPKRYHNVLRELEESYEDGLDAMRRDVEYANEVLHKVVRSLEEWAST